jgi:AcrR family transcriptional regulator
MADATRAPGRRSLQKAATKAALLDAGKVIIDQKYSTPATLKAVEVARSIGLTTGAFYHYWPTEQCYRLELLRELLGDFMSTAATMLPEGLKESVHARRVMKFMTGSSVGPAYSEMFRALTEQFQAQCRLTPAEAACFWGELLLRDITESPH